MLLKTKDLLLATEELLEQAIDSDALITGELHAVCIVLRGSVRLLEHLEDDTKEERKIRTYGSKS